MPLSLGIAVASDAPLTAGPDRGRRRRHRGRRPRRLPAAGQRPRGRPHGDRRRPRHPLRLGRHLRDHRRAPACCQILFGLLPARPGGARDLARRRARDARRDRRDDRARASCTWCSAASRRTTRIANVARPARHSSLATARPVRRARALAVIAILLLWPAAGSVRLVAASRRRCSRSRVLTVVASLAGAARRAGGAGGSVPRRDRRCRCCRRSAWRRIVGVCSPSRSSPASRALLSAVAVDKLHDGTRADLDRELFGAGRRPTRSPALLGGLPDHRRHRAQLHQRRRRRATRGPPPSCTASGSWSSRSRCSASSQQIPMAVLAGLLVYIGAKLVNLAHVRELHRHGELPVYVVTHLSASCSSNLLTGVLSRSRRSRCSWSCAAWCGRRSRCQEPAPTSEGPGTSSSRARCASCRFPRLVAALADGPRAEPTSSSTSSPTTSTTPPSTTSPRGRSATALAGGTVRVDEVGTMGLRRAPRGDVARSRPRRPGPVPRFLAPWSTWQASHGGRPRPHRRDEACVESLRGPVRRRRLGPDPRRRCASTTAAPRASSRRTSPTSPTGQAPARVVPDLQRLPRRAERPHLVAAPATCSRSATSATSRPLGVPAGRLRGAHRRVRPRRAGGADARRLRSLRVRRDAGRAAQWRRPPRPPRAPLGRWLSAASESLARCRTATRRPVGDARRGSTRSTGSPWSTSPSSSTASPATPASPPALASGRVRLVGLSFDIPTARMPVLEGDRFVPASPDRVGAGSAPSSRSVREHVGW